ncbi:MAG: hypothetical protein V4730_02255 [Pseudomonadota bacterium]
MTAARDDLKEVNAALRELVRLQLAGELPAQEAWQTRRQMLDSVEVAWHDLSQDVTAEALASKQVLKTPVPPRRSLRERLQQRPKLQLPQLQLPSWHLTRLPSLRWQPLLRAFTHLPWWSLFLVGALATFYYVSTL